MDGARSFRLRFVTRFSLVASLGVFTILVSDLFPRYAMAQQAIKYERGADGVTYQVTTQKVDRLVPTTQMQTREEKTFEPQVTTQYQTYQQPVLQPVTQYRWVSRMKGRWNPFSDPYWTHNLEPVTTWQQATAAVTAPVSTTNWVEKKRTIQQPVVTYQKVQEEYTSRVAVNTPAAPVVPNSLAPNAGATAIATLPAGGVAIGGQRMQSDPPRAGNAWQATSPTGTFRR